MEYRLMRCHHKIHLTEGPHVIFALHAMLDVPANWPSARADCSTPTVAAAALGPEQGR
jgi:hypothetical protein